MARAKTSISFPIDLLLSLKAAAKSKRQKLAPFVCQLCQEGLLRLSSPPPHLAGGH